MRYEDLPTRPKHGVFLLCGHCWQRFSATRGDYWDRDGEIRCSACEELLHLARESCRIVVVTADEAEEQGR